MYKIGETAIKNVIFDLDGTLVDSTEYHFLALTKAIKEHYGEAKIDQKSVKSKGTREILYNRFSFIDDKTTEKIVETKKSEYKKFVEEGKVKLFPCVIELLGLLDAQRKKLYILTASSKESAKLTIEELGLERFFDENNTFTRESFEGHQKSKSTLYQNFEAYTSCDPNETIFIDDDVNALKAAHSEKFKTILIDEDYAYHPFTVTFKNISSLFLDATETIINNIDLSMRRKIVEDNQKNMLPKNYGGASDKEFLHLIEMGIELQQTVCLLRIGGPLLIRELLKHQNIFHHRITDESIKKVKILICEPRSSNLLKRFDAELKSNLEIWHKTVQIAQFISTLVDCQTNMNNLSIEIRIHNRELLWNIGLIENFISIIRPYSNKITGHDDSMKSFKYSFEGQGMAEVSKTYFDTLYNDSSVKIISPNINLSTELQPWPSLFKNNITLSKNTKLSESEDIIEIQDKTLLKICINENVQKVESYFYKALSEQKDLLKNSKFKPVRIRIYDKKNKILEKQTILCLEHITGFNLFDVVANLKLVSDSNIRSILLKGILKNSIDAQKDFWKISSSLMRILTVQTLSPKIYNYKNKLESARMDVIMIVNVEGLKKELEKLSYLLDKFLNNPREQKVLFRDAHLKNRIWRTNTKKMCDFIKELEDQHESIGVLVDNIYDIDFETVGNYVSKYEDINHILLFEHSGFRAEKKNEKLSSYYEKFMGTPPENPSIFYKSIIARSFREFCRRLWYKFYMPNTFDQRYVNEEGFYFANLCKIAIDEQNEHGEKQDYPFLREFFSKAETFLPNRNKSILNPSSEETRRTTDEVGPTDFFKLNN